MNQKGSSLIVGVLIGLLIAAIVGVAYYFGTKSNQNSNTNAANTPSYNTASPAPTQPIPANTPAATPQPTSTTKKVSGGINNQLFSQYTATVPGGWVDKSSSNTASNDQTLTKGLYTITISQAAGGAGSCNYPGDTPEPMAQVFTGFVGIMGTSAEFRRGTSDNLSYTICEKKSSGYVFPTTFGYITYTVPSQADQSTIAEMDSIIASLAK